MVTDGFNHEQCSSRVTPSHDQGTLVPQCSFSEFHNMSATLKLLNGDDIHI